MPRSLPSSRASAGFSLIELMIVVVIIGVLARLAYPMYQDHIDKTRRADGKAALLETAQQLERCYTRVHAYTEAAGCDVEFPRASSEGHYSITAPTRTGNAFTLHATPVGIQTRDESVCGVLTLTHTGQRGSQGQVGQDDNQCW